MALHGTEAWGLKSTERSKVNVLEMKWLIGLVRVSRLYRVRNEEVEVLRRAEYYIANNTIIHFIETRLQNIQSAR